MDSNKKKKICNKCQQIKDLTEFSRNLTKRDGLNYQCKECQVIYFRAYYKINKQSHIQRVRASQRRQYDPDHDISSEFFTLRYKVRRSPRAKRKVYINKRFKLKKSWKASLMFKVKRFKKGSHMKFSTQDVLDKWGETPTCYLTGAQLDLKNPTSFELDHIIPKCKGGLNTLDNLGICCPEANRAKNGMALDDFIALCKAVANNFS